jgi:cytochrome c2
VLVCVGLAATALAQDAKVAQGEKLFVDQKCTLCHSVGDKGNKKGALDGVATKLKADEIREWIVDAKGMTAKTKPTRKPDMKAYTLPKDDKALKASYPTQEAAAVAIGASLREFYRGGYPEVFASRSKEIEQAVAAATRIYRGNVFPEMHVGFGTYPNNIGHIDSAGCFRCHDDNHKTKDGKAIGQDCETCHKIE